MAKSRPEQRIREARTGRKQGRTQGEGKRQHRQKVGGGVRKGKGKGKGLQCVNEWDQTDGYTSVPILSVSCGEKQPEKFW